MFPLPTVEPAQEIVLTEGSQEAEPRDTSCIFHTCFDVYDCGYNDETRVSIYMYPPAKFKDSNGIPLMLPMSQEYSEVLQVSQLISIFLVTYRSAVIADHNQNY